MAADAAVEFLLSELKQLLLEYANSFSLEFERTVKSKIRETEDSIQLLQPNPSARPLQRGWDHKIRLEAHLTDLTYRFDNVKETFDTVTASTGRKKFGWISRRFDLRRLKYLRDINADIEEVNDRIEYHRRLIRDMEGPPTDLTGNTYSHRPLQGQCFVGRGKEIEHLMEYVVGKPDYRVVAIYGNAASGKSVLAGELYRNTEVRRYFDAFAWVLVSGVSGRKEIIELLYEQLLYKEWSSSDLNVAELAERLYRIQQERRCLIVLDDVRSTVVLESLRVAFPPGRGEQSSKILITTRDPQVVEAAEIVTAKKYIHRLKCLTDEEGRDLLRTHIVSGGVPEHESIRIVEEIGTTVVKGCEGWPLNIVRFAQCEEMKRILDQQTVPVGDLEQLIPKSLLRETDLSKNYDLPHFLKRCFLYMGILQYHSSQTQVEKQYLLWLADGVLLPAQCRMNETLMNVGERYLEELAQKDMVVVHDEEVPTLTGYHTFQLSLLMQKLCWVMNQEVNEFRVVDLGRRTDSHVPAAPRFAINLDGYDDLFSLPIADHEIPRIRCLLLCLKENQTRNSVQFKHLRRIFKFTSLRILDFMGFSFQQKKLLKGITNLVLLRYLSFQGCDMAELPSSIGNLEGLLVLDLRVKSVEMVIPNILRKLKALMHLYLPQSYRVRGASAKLRLAGLTKLQTITNLDTQMTAMEDLLELPNIRYLAARIRGSLEEIEKVVELMNAKSDVQVFRASVDISDFDCYTKKRHSVLGQVLGCPSLVILHMSGYISQLPKLKIHSNLVEIVLVGSELREDSIKTLESFPKLRALVLKNNAYMGNNMICSASGFSELRRMELQNLERLKVWEVKEGAMPRLSNLVIVNCGELRMQPQKLEFVKRVPKVKASAIHETLKHNLSQVKGDVTFED